MRRYFDQARLVPGAMGQAGTLLAAGVTIDLAAPASGLFARALVDEDDVVFPGAVLAEFVVALDAGGRDE